MRLLQKIAACILLALSLASQANAGLITYRWSFTDESDEYSGMGTASGTLTYAFRKGQNYAPIRSVWVTEIPSNHENQWGGRFAGEMVREDGWAEFMEYYYIGGLSMVVNPITSEPIQFRIDASWAYESEDVKFYLQSYSPYGNSSTSVISSMGQKYYYVHTEGPATLERLSPPVPEPTALIIWSTIGMFAYRGRQGLRTKCRL